MSQVITIRVSTKVILRDLPDEDIKRLVHEVLEWRSSGNLPTEAMLRQLAEKLVNESGLDEEDVLRNADSLVITEAARRFAKQP